MPQFLSNPASPLVVDSPIASESDQVAAFTDTSQIIPLTVVMLGELLLMFKLHNHSWLLPATGLNPRLPVCYPWGSPTLPSEFPSTPLAAGDPCRNFTYYVYLSPGLHSSLGLTRPWRAENRKSFGPKSKDFPSVQGLYSPWEPGTVVLVLILNQLGPTLGTILTSKLDTIYLYLKNNQIF